MSHNYKTLKLNKKKSLIINTNYLIQVKQLKEEKKSEYNFSFPNCSRYFISFIAKFNKAS